MRGAPITISSSAIPIRAPRGLTWPGLAAVTGSLVGAASSLVPMSYDEAYWVGVARMVESGRVLYQEAIDNKSPLVYGLSWLLDALPGPYETWRGPFVGLVAAALVLGLRQMMGSRATSLPWFPIGLTVLIVLLAELQIAVELIAVLLLVWALGGRFAWLGSGLLLLLATAFDPRVLLLLPGAYLLLRQQPGRRIGLLLAAGALVGVGLVLAVPDLRYALVELNLVSRTSEWRPGPLASIAAATLPVAAYLPFLPFVDISAAPAGTKALAIAALLIAVASLLGIPHYWIYLAPVLAIAAREKSSARPALVAGLLLIALIPLGLNTIRSVGLHHQQRSIAAEVASQLSFRLDPSAKYAAFGALPHLVVLLPEQNALRSPTSHYLATGTSRGAAHLTALADVLHSVDAIVDAGGLAVPLEAVFPRHRAARELFHSHLEDFRCVIHLPSASLHLREGCDR